MDIYKDYMYQLRKLSFVDTYIKVHGDVTPKLKHYIKLLNDVKYEDGAYHTYYGEIKKIVNSFITCWTKIMDDAIRVVDRYTNIITKDDLLELMECTINIHRMKQIDWGRDFLPVRSDQDKEIYEEVEEGFNDFMDRLYGLREEIERLDKQDKVKNFAKTHFPISLKKKNEVFQFTYSFIAELLANHADQIRISLEEILLRARNNLRAIQETTTSSINSLLQQLYDKNKEHLGISRQDCRSSAEIAEVRLRLHNNVLHYTRVQRSMDILKDKIEDSKQVPIARLSDEYKYWQDRLIEFKHITNALNKLNEEVHKIIEQEKMFNDLKCCEIPESRHKCWEETNKTLEVNRKAIRDMKTKAAKAIMTFFSVRGPDRVIYADNVGPYFVDDYGHQVYFFDYGLGVFHVDCEGNFVEAQDNEKYFYDNMGRYVFDSDGTKLYKMGPCTSSYELINDVFEKHTKDCGHSEKLVEGCRLQIKNPNDVCILPLIEEIEIKGMLDADESTYLWESFGHILPIALRDVAVAQPRNPIHYLAHKLLFHKYSRSVGELSAMKEEALKYREKTLQDRKDIQCNSGAQDRTHVNVLIPSAQLYNGHIIVRCCQDKEKAEAARKAWKAKLVQRRKPEESDDTTDRFVYDTYVAKQDFVRCLNDNN